MEDILYLSKGIIRQLMMKLYILTGLNLFLLIILKSKQNNEIGNTNETSVNIKEVSNSKSLHWFYLLYIIPVIIIILLIYIIRSRKKKILFE